MDQITIRAPVAVPLPPRSPERPFEALLAASPDAFGAIYEHMRERHDPDGIRRAIARAEAFMADAATASETLHQGVELADPEAITRQLQAFVIAWPNTANADLRGYAVQLSDDVEEHRPCRYALAEALRHLRQTSRFLPSIAEVLTALDEAQARIRNTAWHVNQIPAELETARADLAKAEAFEAERAAKRRPAPDHHSEEHPAP